MSQNLLSRRAASVLGPALYARYLSACVANLPQIVRARNLSPLDRSMGAVARRFHYRGSTFVFDCPYCDEHLDEDSSAFGLAREIYIRDCYFRWLPPQVFETARTVIDLGANRGAFSALMTTRAKFILSVECQDVYAPLLHHNIVANGFTGYAVETALVGTGGLLEDSGSPRVTMGQLMLRHGLQTVDLVKLDIEGSEFALFESDDWLRHVHAITMEIHPTYGTPKSLLDTLRRQGFACAMADAQVGRVQDVECASFLYGWRD